MVGWTTLLLFVNQLECPDPLASMKMYKYQVGGIYSARKAFQPNTFRVQKVKSTNHYSGYFENAIHETKSDFAGSYIHPQA